MFPLPKTCTNEACRLATEGKCVEGYDLDDCPHVSRVSVEDIDEVEEPEALPDIPQMIALSLGEALSRDEASSLQRKRVSRAVAIVGANDAGKTSLIASIYDLLQEGPIANVSFGGSSTLVGFEKVCHDARAACRRDAPHTERTSAGGDASFFHLDLRASHSELVSLFIADRSGEDYLAASDELLRAGEFFELRRADVVTLLVNGEHLASPEYRHEARAVTPQIADALMEAGALRPGCRLAVVLTKQDSVFASPHAKRVEREFDAIVDAIIRSHSGYLGDIERFSIAASPKSAANVKRGDGVDQLLLFWLRAAALLPPTRPIVSASKRMIDLLKSDGEVTA